MSNVRGIVKFEAGGSTYSLQYSINALVALEEDLGVTVAEIGTKLSGKDGKQVGLKDMRTLFRCGLIEHWPDGEPTVKQAGSLMTDVGLGPVAELIGEAFAAAFPDAVEVVDAGPAKAKAGNVPKK